MNITRVDSDTRKKSRWVLAAAQWGSGMEVHENKNWKSPPSGKVIGIEFTLTNEEIHQWGQRPEWQVSEEIGTLARTV